MASNGLGLRVNAPTAPLPVKRPPSPGSVTIDVPERTLVLWNAAMALFHTTLAVVTLSVGRTDLAPPTFKVQTEFSFRNESDPEAGWDLRPYFVESGSLYLTWYVAAFFGLSALFHLLNATVLRDFYLRELAECRTPTRWIEYFFSASVMIVIIAYSLGVRDRMTLFAIGFLVASTMPYGYWTEVVARPCGPDAWSEPLRVRLYPWLLGHVPQLGAWFLILLQFYDGGDADAIPWFVYLILWGELLLFFSFGFVQVYSQSLPPRLFYQGELAFQVLSLVAKGLLGVVLLANVLMLSRFEDIYEVAAVA